MAKCPDSERTRHATMGALILITACTAGVAMHNAALRVFESEPIALALATGYGAFVFCLDRFMISTIRKRGAFSGAGQALVRVAVAFLMAIVIAAPLEVRITRDRVARRREESRQQALERGRETFARTTGLAAATADLAERNMALDGVLRRLGEDPPGGLFQETMRNLGPCRAKSRAPHRAAAPG